MNVYLKMILMKLRFALMLRYAPKTKKSIESTLSSSDMEFIENLISSKPDHVSSNTLVILLDAYQALRYSVINSLPLEMALVKILNAEEK